MTIPLHPRVAAAIPVLLAVALAGCSSDGSCETSALCEAGTFCFEGACVASLPPGSYTSPGSPAPVYGGVISATPSTCPVPPATADPIAFPAGWVQDLPPALVGDTVSFEVPAGTASVTIHLQAESATQRVNFLDGSWDFNYVVPAEVELPNGDVLYEYLDALTSPTDPSLESAYFSPIPWTATFMVPAGHRLADLALARGSLPSGTWRLRLADYQAECGLFGGCTSNPPAPGVYRATVVAKPGPYVASGALDVAVYFVSGPPGEVTAQAASASLAYQRFVRGIDRLLGRAGIIVGAVRFLEIPNTAASEFYSTNVSGAPPCGQLSRLFALARPAPGDDGVRIFLVDDLVSDSGHVVGLTGSIPGPTGIPGAVTSGIAMSLADINLDLLNADRQKIGTCDTSTPALDLHCNADFYAYVAAHEIGHWLGLFHPTESSGDLYDPLADTATCGCDACSPYGCPAPYPPGVDAGTCAAEDGPCAGGKNLMFWQVDPAVSRGDVSREQGLVMRANPAVKWGIP